MRHPILRTALPALCADLLSDLDLHQLAADRLHRRAQHIRLLLKPS
jgi:hypothetical protein